MDMGLARANLFHENRWFLNETRPIIEYSPELESNQGKKVIECSPANDPIIYEFDIVTFKFL